MTANEFLENVNEWWELKDFCSETGCDYCEDIVDEETLDEDVEYALSEYHRDYNWREVRDLLDDIPTGYDYYRCDGSFDYVGLDDEDFESLKEDVYDWAFNNGYFDDEEEEEEVEDGALLDEDFFDSSEPEEDPVEDEDFSVSDLMGMCSVTLITIQKDSVRRAQESEAALNQYINVNIPKVLK